MCALFACASPEARTEIALLVETDIPAADIDQLEVTASGAQAGMARMFPLGGTTGRRLPLTIGLTPATDTNGPVTVTVVASRGSRIVTRIEARTRFIARRRLLLRVFLPSQCIDMLSCPTLQTCGMDGMCRDSFVDPASLPRFDGRDGGLPETGTMDGRETGVPETGVPETGILDGETGVANPDGDNPDAVDAPDVRLPMCTSPTSCDDANFCNGAEQCVEGQCVAGTEPPCDDRVACTRDSCAGNACVNMPDDSLCLLAPGGRCDVTNGCQYSACNATTCVAGPCETATCMGPTCVHASRCGATQQCCGGMCVARGCDDGNVCTSDSCGMSGCVNTPNSSTCSDGNGCTVGDMCSGGTCRPGTAMGCDDGNTCTMDRCEPSTGMCVRTPVAGSCSDGNACTQNDMCSGGTCVSGPLNRCDDGIACTADSCASGACVNAPNNSLCTAAAGGTCTVSGCQYPSCNASTCVRADLCETATCTTPSTCSRTRTCSPSQCCGGSCCTGSQVCCGGACMNCDDGNPCTVDACGGAACTHTPTANGFSCNDGNACTRNDVCTGGGASGCQGTAINPAVDCNDNNPCTDDTCLPASGCSRTNNTAACNDNNECNTVGGDRCSGGVCVGTGTRPCNDGNVCTNDGCSTLTGCVFTPTSGASCDGDGDPCNGTATCSGATCMPGPPPTCLPTGNECLTNSCVTGQGCRVSSLGAIPCSNPTTPPTNCQHGQCVGGVCSAVNNNAGTSCDDGNPCTTGESCNGFGGCTGGSGCDDSQACTTDTCGPSGCVHTTISCDDGLWCTQDLPCDFGMQRCPWPAEPTGSDCGPQADSDPCTLDFCQSGTCVHPPDPCNDFNDCTFDFCAAGVGCRHNVIGEPCGGSCCADSCCDGICCSSGCCGSFLCC